MFLFKYDLIFKIREEGFHQSTSMSNKLLKPAILIVEDHDGVRTFLHEWLSETFPDYIFFEAVNGEEAVAIACDKPPAIVLMDIGLPKMNGIEATRRIKAAMPQVQVVIITNHEASEFEREAAIAGASAYLLKNRMNTELIPIVMRLLSQAE